MVVLCEIWQAVRAIDYMRPPCFSWVIEIALAPFDVMNHVLSVAILTAILSVAVSCDAIYSSVVEDFSNSYLCVVVIRVLLEQIYRSPCYHHLCEHHVGLQIVEHPLCCLVNDGGWSLLWHLGFVIAHVLHAFGLAHPGWCGL
jgi:hypothetical protein